MVYFKFLLCYSTMLFEDKKNMTFILEKIKTALLQEQDRWNLWLPILFGGGIRIQTSVDSLGRRLWSPIYK